MTDHLDPLELDAVRAGEASPAQNDHASRCPACAAEVERLRRLAEGLAGPRIEVPPEVRHAVLALAGRRMRPRRRLWIPLAAAAALLLGLVALWPRTSAPEDVDRSGAVDVLDAYALALRLRSGARLDPRWDVNRDGVVDRRDVDEIARRSVSLSRRGS